MATIRKRNGKWQVQVRRTGSKPISRTFTLKRDAEAWAREAEIAHERGGTPLEDRQKLALTLADVLDRYHREVSPTKKSAHIERYRIGLISRDELGRRPIGDIRPGDIAGYRDRRLSKVSTETVRQDLVLIRQVIEVARLEWGFPLSRNPVDEVRKPKPAKARTRRLREGEVKALEHALIKTRNSVMRDLVRFAIASGMRRGEMLRIEWAHVDWKPHVLYIPETKNGHARTIPLSDSALGVLKRRLEATDGEGRVFPISPNAVRLAWEHIRERAGLEELRFHDLRREAISRFFEIGLSVPEVALISGHRDIRQLSRYSAFEASRVAKKLRLPSECE